MDTTEETQILFDTLCDAFGVLSRVNYSAKRLGLKRTEEAFSLISEEINELSEKGYTQNGTTSEHKQQVEAIRL
jgi:hypothetical protein